LDVFDFIAFAKPSLMKFIFSPILLLVLFWLALSGHYTALLLALGAVSCVGVQLIAKRMQIIDHEGYPIHLISWRIVPYWIWLIKEILLSTMAVAKLILTPKDNLRQSVARLPATKMSDMEKSIYANSITLTPGTLTLEIDQSHIEVHTLRDDMLTMLQRGEMADRVRTLKNKSKVLTR